MRAVFISFAVEDSHFRDLFVGQSRNSRSPFEFRDMSVKQPWDSSWKTNCRTKIKGCAGLIALVSPNTVQADGARWEIKCALEERVPVLGVLTQSSNRWVQVPELVGQRVIEWNQQAIANFIDGLA